MVKEEWSHPPGLENQIVRAHGNIENIVEAYNSDAMDVVINDVEKLNREIDTKTGFNNSPTPIISVASSYSSSSTQPEDSNTNAGLISRGACVRQSIVAYKNTIGRLVRVN